MSLNEKDILEVSLSILAGLLMIIFRKPFANRVIAFQNTVWGFNFGKREIVISEIIVTIVGLLFILLGLQELGLF